jgi:hypothetical protein
VHWEQGTHTPRHLALVRLADALAVSRQWLTAGSDAGGASIQVQGGGAARTQTREARSPEGSGTGVPAPAPSGPMLDYLAAPLRHIRVVDWLDAGAILAALDTQGALDRHGALAGLVPWAGPVLRPLGIIVRDPAVRQSFPAGSTAVLECAASDTARPRDRAWYLLEAGGQMMVRRFRQAGSPAGQYEADSPRDVLDAVRPVRLLGRVVGLVRRFDA